MRYHNTPFSALLAGIPNWQDLSNRAIGAHLGLTPGAINYRFSTNPELSAQRRIKPSRLLSDEAGAQVDQILALPGWRDRSFHDIARALGVTLARARILILKHPRLSGLKKHGGHRVRGNPATAASILAIPEWSKMTRGELANHLTCDPSLISKIMASQPDLFSTWEPRLGFSVDRDVQSLLAIPGWEDMTKTEMARVCGMIFERVHTVMLARPAAFFGWKGRRSRKAQPGCKSAGRRAESEMLLFI